MKLIKPEEPMEVQSSYKERLFTKAYLDFLDSTVLTGDEKIIYLCLKRFLNVADSSGSVFPSMAKLMEMTQRSDKFIRTQLRSLQKKGAIKIVRRGLTKSNLYILNDNEAMWKAETEDELIQAAEETELEKALRLVRESGLYEIQRKEKEPSSTSDQTNDEDPKDSKKYSFDNNNIEGREKQDIYSLGFIKKQIEYEILISDNPSDQMLINAICELIYDTLNIKREHVRVSGENVPWEIVKNRLLKLDQFTVQYVIGKYRELDGKIKNHTGYLLTMLYKASQQMNAELSVAMSVPMPATEKKKD